MSVQGVHQPLQSTKIARRSAWWARHLREMPLTEEIACPKDDCTKSTTSPFDLYCREGDSNPNEFHFVVLGADRRLQLIAVYVTRAIFGLLAVIAAYSASPIPLDIGAGLAGALLLVLPLRLFETSRAVAPIIWICVLVLAVAAHEGWMSASQGRDTLAVIIAIAVAALVAAVIMHRDVEHSDDLVYRGVAVGLSVALGSALLFVLSALSGDVVGEAVRNALLAICLVAIGSVACGTALSGFILGFHEVKTDDIKLRKRKPFDEPQFGYPLDPSSIATSTRRGLVTYVYVGLVALARVVNRWVDMVNLVLRIIYRAINAVVRAVLWAKWKIRLSVMWTYRVIGRAAIDALAALKMAVGIVMIVIRHWVESTVLGLALFICAAELAVTICTLFSSYLGGGTVLDGVGSLALVLPVASALIVVWWVLTKWSVGHIAKSALHTIEGAGPTLFLTLVALGWVDGLIGMLGFGPIRPGWLTISGTVILVVSTGYLLIKEKRTHHKLEKLGGTA
jgi:hypothetical protein